MIAFTQSSFATRLPCLLVGVDHRGLAGAVRTRRRHHSGRASPRGSTRGGAAHGKSGLQLWFCPLPHFVLSPLLFVWSLLLPPSSYLVQILPYMQHRTSGRTSELGVRHFSWASARSSLVAVVRTAVAAARSSGRSLTRHHMHPPVHPLRSACDYHCHYHYNCHCRCHCRCAAG